LKNKLKWPGRSSDLSGHFYVFSLLNPDLSERRFSGVLYILIRQLNIPQLLAQCFLFMLQVVHFITIQNQHNTTVGYFNGEMCACLNPRFRQSLHDGQRLMVGIKH